MAPRPAAPRDLFPADDQLAQARDVLRSEAAALTQLTERLRGGDRLGSAFCAAVDAIYGCTGRVVVCGIGKAGLVGRKLVATLASTGTRSQFLHPAEAVHGDLGQIGPDDVILVLSMSGASEEIVRLLPSFHEFKTPVIALTGRPDSPLGRAARVVLDLGPLREACPLGLAPSTSTTAMLALGDALALVVSRRREFSPLDFARYHPGGSLGRRLAKVEEWMRPYDECRLSSDRLSVREVFVQLSRPGRRTGAIMLVNDEGRLTGLFTDSDLARLVEQHRDADFDRPIAGVMTRNPLTIRHGASLEDAIALLAERRLSELPVVDADGRPCGLLDITDVVGAASRPIAKPLDAPLDSTSPPPAPAVDARPTASAASTAEPTAEPSAAIPSGPDESISTILFDPLAASGSRRRRR